MTTHLLHFSIDNLSDFRWELPIEEEKDYLNEPCKDCDKYDNDKYDNFDPVVEGPCPRGRHTATEINGKI
jgi:hypothetical protein